MASRSSLAGGRRDKLDKTQLGAYSTQIGSYVKGLSNDTF